MKHIQKGLAFLFVSCVAWAGMHAVGPPCQPGEPGRGGVVTEHSRLPNTDFIVHITDLNGNDLFTVPLTGTNVPGDGSVATYVQPPGVPGVCDAWNETVLPGSGGVAGGGANSGLFLESYLLDPITNRYVMYDIWDTVSTLGVLRIPDLYADTNGNGFLDHGDFLYGVINLANFNALPTFNFGDHFSIMNGHAPGVDMFFSTTRPVFNPMTGFTGTPYTGDAIAETDHQFVPEPNTLLLAIGAILIMAAIWKRRTLQEGKKETNPAAAR